VRGLQPFSQTKKWLADNEIESFGYYTAQITVGTEKPSEPPADDTGPYERPNKEGDKMAYGR